MGRRPRYRLRELEIGEWFFIEHEDVEVRNKLYKSAHVFAWRNKGYRFKIRRGSHKGKAGTWCQRIPMDDNGHLIESYGITPAPNETVEGPALQWPVDKAHYMGKLFIPLPGEPQSSELAAAATSLARCRRNYEKRNHVKFYVKPMIQGESFGHMLTLVESVPI